MTEGSLGVVIWFWTLSGKTIIHLGITSLKDAKGKILQAKKFAWSLLFSENHAFGKTSHIQTCLFKYESIENYY